MILFGSNRRFNLYQVPFSRKGAFIGVYQNPEDKQLYFTHCRSEHVIHKRPNLMRIALMDGDTELPFVYESDEAKLTVKTAKGTVEITYDNAQVMRIRVNGVSLRFFFDPEKHEGADVRADDEIEIGLNFLGKLLFKGISGGFATTAKWNFREVRPFPLTITISPGKDGVGETAVHEYESSGLPHPVYRPFDEAEADNRAAFERFAAAYPQAPPVFSEAMRRDAWVVWISLMGPRGSLKETVVFMHKLLLVRAAGWQQCYAAMAMKHDIKQAWVLLLSFFQFQDKYGGIPDNTADVNQEIWVSTKPPLFGYAVCYILEHFDVSELSEADYRELFDKLSKYRNWWFVNHDHAKTGYPSYYHVDESGYDEASIFAHGMPLHSPDLLTYMVLLDSALEKLANILGLDEKVAFHERESERVLRYLCDELWDGEGFRSRTVRDGKLHTSYSAAHIQPLLLGDRLPKPILETLKARVLDETQFLSDYGVTSENMQSPDFTMKSFTRGPVLSPVNFQVIMGLLDAGEAIAAEKIAMRFLNALMIHGPVLGVSPFRVDPQTYQELDDYAKNQIGAPLTAWGASVFMAIVGRLYA